MSQPDHGHEILTLDQPRRTQRDPVLTLHIFEDGWFEYTAVVEVGEDVGVTVVVRDGWLLDAIED